MDVTVNWSDDYYSVAVYMHKSSHGPLQVRIHMAEMAIAVEYIHSMGVVHRDIKPDNLLMDADGHVHLADFNVASFIPENALMYSRAGTRPYMGMLPFPDASCVNLSLKLCYTDISKHVSPPPPVPRPAPG